MRLYQNNKPIAYPLMPTASTTEYAQCALSTHQTESTPIQQAKQEERYIFVVRQHDGTTLIGVSTCPGKRIAAINSAMHPHIRQSLTIKEIIGIKPVTAERSLISVFKHFESILGEGKVMVV